MQGFRKPARSLLSILVVAASAIAFLVSTGVGVVWPLGMARADSRSGAGRSPFLAGRRRRCLHRITFSVISVWLERPAVHRRACCRDDYVLLAMAKTPPAVPDATVPEEIQTYGYALIVARTTSCGCPGGQAVEGRGPKMLRTANAVKYTRPSWREKDAVKVYTEGIQQSIAYFR